MSKISPINSITTRFRKNKIINSNIQPFKQSSKRLRQLTADSLELSRYRREIYENYKGIEEIGPLLSFEKKEMVKMEDGLSHGFFRDEEAFDNISEHVASVYDLDDIPMPASSKIQNLIPTVYSLDTDLEECISRKLKRIEVGNKLVKFAHKVGRNLKIAETSSIAEEAMKQKEAGLPKEQILKNFRNSFLHNISPMNEEFSLELFQFLGKYPDRRPEVVEFCYNGEEIVNKARIAHINDDNIFTRSLRETDDSRYFSY